MNSCPELSFVMPAYKPQFLKQAVDSIIAQTFQDWELIVVDDCSPFNLKSIIGGFNDRRILYYRNSSNIGGQNLIRQWNHCLSLATGKWIVMAADDDIYYPEFAATIHRLSNSYPKVDLIRSRVHLIATDGKENWNDCIFPEMIDKCEFLNSWIENKAFICIGNYAFRRSKLKEIGGFIDFPCAFYSDIATPIAMSVNGVANTPDTLFGFRLSDIHLSADGSHLKERIEAITLFYKWLSSLDYLTKSQRYMHRKCVFDYFNQAIRFLKFKQLPQYLKYCSEATFLDKATYILPRWFKHRINP